MRNALLAIVLFFLAASGLVAQIDNSAPVVWERYKVSDRNVSFLFPKMPTVHVSPSICGEFKSLMYLAYAEGVIYEVVIAGPKRSVTQVNCNGKIVSHTPRKLDERLAELRTRRDREQTVRINGADVIHFSTERSARWIIPNASTPARWIEVAVAHYPYRKIDANALLESIQFSATEGKEIGSGSAFTLGDKGVTHSWGASSNPLARTTSPVTLYWQPRSYYVKKTPTTEELSVRLEVTFLANGSVGKIVANKELPDGLTQHAIADVRRISFLPKRTNGLPVDSEETLKYVFH